MFVTLRRNENTLSIERKDFAPSHQACGNCRAKKMRCSGQRGGCHRCLTRGLSCAYPHSVDRRGQKRQRMNSEEATDKSPSDGHIFASDAPQCTRRSPTPSSETSLQGSNSYITTQGSPRSLGVANIQRTPSNLDSGSHASAISEFFCDFVAPYVPNTQQAILSIDNMCTSISATASDVRTGDSSSCMSSKIAGQSMSVARGPASTRERLATKPCECVSFMLSLLEDSEIEGARLSLGTIDHFLRLNKHGLAKCNRVLECRECCANSKLIMLIITICRTMVSQHERMYEILVHQYEKLQRLGRKTRPISSRDDHVGSAEPALEAPTAPVLTMGIVALNDYEVDAFEEPCVFGGLATLQQRALLRFMAQLKLLCVNPDWNTQREMLGALEKRVKEQLERVRTYHENNEG